MWLQVLESFDTFDCLWPGYVAGSMDVRFHIELQLSVIKVLSIKRKRSKVGCEEVQSWE